MVCFKELHVQINEKGTSTVKKYSMKIEYGPFTIQFIILKVKKCNQNLTHVGFCKIHTKNERKYTSYFLYQFKFEFKSCFNHDTSFTQIQVAIKVIYV